MKDILTEIEQDAVTELLNIAIGDSGRALSELVDEPILLSVPKINFVSKSDAVHAVDKQTKGEGSAIREAFSGPFSGHMLLIFPENQSLELVRQMIGEDAELDTITEMEQDALLEVGNVIMTSCLVSLADAFEVSITSEIPELVKGHGSDMINTGDLSDDCLVMFLEVDFHLRKSDISGNVMVVLDMIAVGKLKEFLGQYLQAMEA